MFLCAKTDTFSYVFIYSSSKVPRVEDQVRAPSPIDNIFGSDEACWNSVQILFEETDQDAEDEADDPPEVPKPPETLIPESRPSLTQ